MTDLELNWSGDREDPGDAELARLVRGRVALIDVRAPTEFATGKIPGAVNLPLLDNEQRAAVGTEYKRRGSDAAVQLGHRFISGETRAARLQAWRDYARTHPEAWVYCFRGGLRSRLTCEALEECGVRLPRLEGGYKRFRQFATTVIARAAAEEKFVVLSGFTGAGKTEFLRQPTLHPMRICDLEKAAHHRGSAFGAFGFGAPQSSQADFEHLLAFDFLHAGPPTTPIVIEDESRMIGRAVIPAEVFERMTKAPLIVLERPLAERAQALVRSYLEENYGPPAQASPGAIAPSAFGPGQIDALERDVRGSLGAIQKSLGGALYRELVVEFEDALAEHRRTGRSDVHLGWVEVLLESYYDPRYRHHLDKNRDRVIARGSADELRASWPT